MELKYVVLTIIKILISVPGILLYHQVEGIVLMGGHMDNKNISTNSTNLSNQTTIFNSSIIEPNQESEEIPDPSPLVLPGYNLPENIFNKGKPFYLEKDPLTGKVDFDTKNPSVKLDDDLYDYTNDEDDDTNDDNYKDKQSTSFNIYDKANIDRKDGSLSSHQPSDINQLTPNFHDFLNLPVKYNSDKYVYPLISSSYANTKIQGNVNKYHNHKDYHDKYSTPKSTVSPTYYFDKVNKVETKPTTTTTTTSTTGKPTTQIYFTTNGVNLMNSGMNHPSFQEDFEYYEYDETTKPKDVYLTTKSVDKIYLTTTLPSVKTTISTTPPTTTTTIKASTTTKKVMSLFEQLFGDYEDVMSTTAKLPQFFENSPNNNKQNKITTEKTITITTAPTTTTIKNILTESQMSLTPETLNNSYEYEDYVDDNVAVENQPVIITANSTKTTTTTTTTTTTPKPTTTITTTTPPSSTMKVTSLPLGENHIGSLNNHQPIIVATQNLREKLNSERVSERPQLLPPKTSNIHIAPNQDTVSFVVGHYQNVDGTPPINQNNFHQTIEYQQQQPQSFLTNTITIRPQKNPEASLSIGVPVDTLQQKPGQVVDDQLEITTGSKIIFPDDKETETDNLPPSLLIPPPSPPNREILKLNSKPMYHQLPSDLTPPKEQDVLPPMPPSPTILDRPRPPWDPRPGHFFSGKPEYVRPPRPPLPPSQDLQFKRIDNLPNILPQFRPNMKPHYLNRQPLLERPSNRPVGFFEKLQPPPPPPKNLHNLRKIPPQNLDYQPPKDNLPDQMNLYKIPPKVMIANRRIGNLEGDVETLQMIQAKKIEKTTTSPPEIISEVIKNGTEKPLYVVYPVNTPPIKMDVIDTNKKETVVIGTRAELPLPPSKIQSDFNFQQSNRHDAPILKPHNHHHAFPVKSEFPYPLERPDPSILNPAVPETPQNHLDDADYIAGNHWNTIGENLESRVVNNGKLPSSNQISVTLKTFTEKPIAVAYTPTQPNHHEKYDFEKYSMPNYANPVIPEIRPGTVENVDLNRKKQENEFTVSAIMHTHPQSDVHQLHHHTHHHHSHHHPQQHFSNHRIDTEETSSVHPLDFQAPFQASVSFDSPSSGWSVVRDKNKSTTEEAEVTTIPLATTSEFDIENFQPQLEGGFKPIYNLPTEDLNKNDKSVTISDREE